MIRTVGGVRAIFGLIALISAITALSREEYNLPLFVFLWFIFDRVAEDRKWRQYKYLTGIIILSIVQDFVYIVYWSPKWFSQSWLAMTPKEKGLKTLNMSLITVILLLKTSAVGILFFPDWFGCCSCKESHDIYEEYELIKYHKVPPSGQP